MSTNTPPAALEPSADALDAAARAVITANDRGGYTVPTDGLYPYQWNWDSAFAALGFATFDVPRAWAELETLFSGQWSDGFLPHILFHRLDEGYFPGPEVWRANGGPIASSGVSQPPVAASLARYIYQRDPDAGAAPMGRLFPKMVAWHRWWMTHRAESGAIATVHPWETGRDNAPDWDDALRRIDTSRVGAYQRRDIAHVDAAMRPTNDDYDRYIALVMQGREVDWNQAAIAADAPFRVADPTLTFTLLRAHCDLAALGATLGDSVDADDLADLARWADQLRAGAEERLWNAERSHFDAFDLRSDRYPNSLSNASFLCFWAGLSRPEMLAHLDRVLGLAAYGVPSSDPAESSTFDPRRYWRGPAWGMMNLMIGTGLAQLGEAALAERVRVDTRRLIASNGFAEYFDPTNGAPAGGGDFTWTAAVWLAFASPNAWIPAS